MEENKVCCPKCGSSQISANKKGFSGKKAVAGAVLTGGVGLLAGTIGSNKLMLTCWGCGYNFKAGNYLKEKAKFERIERNKTALASFIKRLFRIG